MRSATFAGALALLSPSGQAAAQPQKQALSAELLDAAVCSASVRKLSDYALPGSDLARGLTVGQAVADIRLTAFGADEKQSKAAETAANDAVNAMIAGKTREQAETALTAKMRECMAFLREPAGEPRDG